MSELDNIVHYLNSLSSPDALYRDPIFSIGILKLMSPDITRLIFDLMTASAHISHLREVSNIKDIVAVLIQIKLINKANNIISLNEVFRTALLSGFCQRTLDARFARASEVSYKNVKTKDGGIPTIKDHGSLKKYILDSSNRKFQSFLQAIVVRPDEQRTSIREILVYCDLIDSFNQITNKGFEFLLKNRKNQMWFILINSIKYFSRSRQEEIKMLGELVEICVKKDLGMYRAARWSEWYSFMDAVGVFCSARQLNGACEDGYLQGSLEGYSDQFNYFVINNTFLFDKTNSMEIKSSKFIVLETNYKIYAYTTKIYEKSILDLFSKLVYNLPNLVKAQLDEESVSGAFSKGITGRQILKYLGEFSEYVPPSVANQILIWEAKQHRINDRAGVLYCDFLHLSDYLRLLKFLEEKGAVLLRDEAKRLIVGTEETFEETKVFLAQL